MGAVGLRNPGLRRPQVTGNYEEIEEFVGMAVETLVNLPASRLRFFCLIPGCESHARELGFGRNYEDGMLLVPMRHRACRVRVK